MGAKSTTGRTPGAEYIGTNRRRVYGEEETGSKVRAESDQTPISEEDRFKE